VQRGDNLWLIAELALGEASAWSRIYRANRNQIRNPRLIYPGQVLVVPRSTRSR
jgi:nucleoid-associated protein YgaU